MRGEAPTSRHRIRCDDRHWIHTDTIVQAIALQLPLQALPGKYNPRRKRDRRCYRTHTFRHLLGGHRCGSLINSLSSPKMKVPYRQRQRFDHHERKSLHMSVSAAIDAGLNGHVQAEITTGRYSTAWCVVCRLRVILSPLSFPLRCSCIGFKGAGLDSRGRPVSLPLTVF